MYLKFFIPNFFTLIRIIFSPIIFKSIINGNYSKALLLISLGGFSDFLDGYFSRKMDSETLFGKIIDPVADKFFIFMIFCGLYSAGLINKFLFSIIILRDFFIGFGAIVLFFNKIYFQVKPIFISKLNTVFQILFPFVVLGIKFITPKNLIFGFHLEIIFSFLIIFSTLISWFFYGIIFFKALQR